MRGTIETERNKASILTKCSVCSKLPWSEDALQRCLCDGFNLDLGCGPSKQPGFVGLDKRPVAGVDIVWDIESVVEGCKCTPSLHWPFLDNSVDNLLCSHVLEHMKPWGFVDIMNEMHRVVKSSGQVQIAVPYAGSYGFWQDPTHTKGINEATFEYFDPTKELYRVYRPSPWSIVRLNYHPLYNLEIVLRPIKNQPIPKVNYSYVTRTPKGNVNGSRKKG